MHQALDTVARLTNERHAQGYRPKPAIEEEEAEVWVDMEKPCHIQVVRQRGRQTHNPNHALR